MKISMNIRYNWNSITASHNVTVFGPQNSLAVSDMETISASHGLTGVNLLSDHPGKVPIRRSRGETSRICLCCNAGRVVHPVMARHFFLCFAL